MSKGKKRLLIGGGIIAVVAIVIANLMGGGNKGIHVQAQKVETLDITEEVSASGYIQPETRVNISSEVTAEIIGLPVKEGQTVTRGEVLIQLDTVQLQKDVDQLRYSLEEMEARTAAAKASFEQANLLYEREKKLYERDHSSETMIEAAESSYLNFK